MKFAAARTALIAAVAGLLPVAASAYPAPPPDPSLPRSTVPVAVQDLRRKMNDADVNALTFHVMDQLFTTRTVARSGAVWQLPRSDHRLDFTYVFEGLTYTPEQFLDRTFTNALLVMKDGVIVSEIYRNNTNDRTRFIGWSMTKSIVSILIGCALQEGRIRSLEDQITAYLPELKGAVASRGGQAERLPQPGTSQPKGPRSASPRSRSCAPSGGVRSRSRGRRNAGGSGYPRR